MRNSGSSPEPQKIRLTGAPGLDWLLLAVVAAIVLDVLGGSPLWIFIFSALGLIPLAAVLGATTDQLANRMGPLAAGVLQSTLGNASELILALAALNAGLLEVVKASLTGSIISNLLLVLGFSMLLGGLKFERQTVNKTVAASNATMLFLAAVGLVVPAVFSLAVYGGLGAEHPSLENLSLWTAGILIIMYGLSLYFQLRAARVSGRTRAVGRRRGPALQMSIAVILTAVLSELLVRELQTAQAAFHGTDLFWGGVIFALIGNAAEHGVAVMAARRNEMDLAMAIGVGSSLQIALLLAPALVFISLWFGHPMSLVFTGIEVAAVVLSTVMVGMIAADGETNWLEGAQLIAVYAILAAGFYFMPL
ncbi:MAG: calcium/proton exchanger [Terriglobales bacterium]